MLRITWNVQANEAEIDAVPLVLAMRVCPSCEPPQAGHHVGKPRCASGGLLVLYSTDRHEVEAYNDCLRAVFMQPPRLILQLIETTGYVLPKTKTVLVSKPDALERNGNLEATDQVANENVDQYLDSGARPPVVR